MKIELLSSKKKENPTKEKEKQQQKTNKQRDRLIDKPFEPLFSFHGRHFWINSLQF